jgi:hypothetical protein
MLATPLFQSRFRHSAGDTADTDRAWTGTPSSSQAFLTALPLLVYIILSELSLEDRPEENY